MQTRRHFLQNMAALAGTAGMSANLLSSIKRAMAIEPDKETTYLDAEHVVILMQENRSFDHAFGTLRGVRGFNDPRAIRLEDGNPVWVQTNEDGEKYIPFRFDIQETKMTWMSDLPHGWTDQVDAARGGLHDRWLHVKKARNDDYKKMPLTLGHYSRDDLPFYYALADAFTICDQNFCSVISSTTPNRLFLWTGTNRNEQTAEAQAVVRNGDCSYGHWANWTTFPERLEDHGVSWKIYQNELTVPTGMSGEQPRWLSNFGCSPIEWFTQYHVRFHQKHREYLEETIQSLQGEVKSIEDELSSKSGKEAQALRKELAKTQKVLARTQQDLAEFSAENFEKLSPREQNLHRRAFCTNTGDPDYRELAELSYEEDGETRKFAVPKGDVLHQFRQDVQQGTLPKVSWIVPAQRFSDHPSSAWYGQWYLSEILNILTENPEVWKKTVFILTYDENDGYYDHIPPFQAPHPKRPETGRVSPGIDTSVDYLEAEQDRKYKPGSAVRDSSLGLGYRVPMIIASPWSRGGAVCSQVFDHTSVLQFLEKLISRQTDREIKESNISAWRRAVCGDLTSAFRPATDAPSQLKGFLDRDTFLKQIYSAQFKDIPRGFHAVSDEELTAIRETPRDSILPRQEPGTRSSCPLPYELSVDGALNQSRTKFQFQFAAGKERFGDRSAGAPFILYAETKDGLKVRNYAVAAGSSVSDAWTLDDFVDGHYVFRIHGPNGFYREFRGTPNDARISVSLENLPSPPASAENSPEHIQIRIACNKMSPKTVLRIEDHSYGNSPVEAKMTPGAIQELSLDIAKSSGWYDFSVTLENDSTFAKRYAGRMESGHWSVSDPAMGNRQHA